MANLPTAHASQAFGHKSVDFYAAPGQVVGSDPRARADERRIQDVDGARHAVRLSEAKFELSPGDLAAVLRVQPGPARKSRPVAVINYNDKSWTRTQPEAGSVLAKAGVARNMNWLASILFMLAAILVVLWPELRAFAVEFFPGSLTVLPAFDIFELTASALPDLAQWRLADSAAPLAGALEQAVPALSGHAPAIVYGLGVALGGIIAFAARSWRLLWLPALVGAIGAGAIGLSGPSGASIAALLALSGVLVFFLIGGAINRARDVWRLEQRIARLADHLLRHPPEEMVVPAGAAAHAGTDSQTLEAGADAQPQSASQSEAAGDEPAATPHPTATAVAAAEAARAAGKSGMLKSGAAGADGPHSPIPAEGQTGTGAGTAPESAPGEADASEPDEIAAQEDEAGRPDGFVAHDETSVENRASVSGEADDLDAGETTGGSAGEAGEAADQGSEEDTAPVRAEDPRHDARDISLPPPPPMPAPARTLQPDAPLEGAGLPDTRSGQQDDTGADRS